MSERLLHIAYVITRGDAVGGATVHVRDMAAHVESIGMRATVLVGGRGEATEAFERAGVAYRSIERLQRSIHPWRDMQAAGEIAGVLREVGPDLVSTHTAKAGVLGRLAARRLGLPVIYTPHGWAISDRISRTSGRVYRLVERSAAPWADAIVNVCEAEKRLAMEHRIAEASKLEVIHNGVRDVGAGLRARPGEEPARVVMVARYEPPKDHDILLRALAGLKDRAWTLELVGSGKREGEVRRLAGELGIAERVSWEPSTANVAERLSRAQVFVLASRSEGFPRSILEAMRAGLPVVASAVGGAAEAVADGETGLVVERDNEGELSRALGLLLGDVGLRRRMGRAGRRRYELNFTFEKMAARTVALYEHLLHRRPAGAALAVGGQ